MAWWLGALAGLGRSGLDSQSPCVTSLTPVSGDAMPSPGFLGHCMHILHKNTCRQNHSDTHNKNKSILNFKKKKVVHAKLLHIILHSSRWQSSSYKVRRGTKRSMQVFLHREKG